jgi:hypothetical protein
LVSGSCGEGFQVEFCVSRDHGHADAVAVAARDQRLKNSFRRKSDLRGDGLGTQVVGIDFVFP